MQPSEVQVKPQEKITQEQTAQSAVKPVETVNKSVEEAKPPIKTEENEVNWRKFREDREIKRKEAEAAQKMAQEERARADALKAALEAITNKPSNDRQIRNQDHEYSEETEDERIQKKIEAAVEARLAKERAHYQKEQAEREQQELPRKVQQAFPDFHQVCSAENEDYLDYHYPEVANAIRHMPEGFERMATVYKTIKKFVPNTDSKKEAARAQQNMQKPGSLSSPGVATGQSAMPPTRLDDARKAANWERMQRTLKGLT
jgi:hypothetical protein